MLDMGIKGGGGGYGGESLRCFQQLTRSPHQRGYYTSSVKEGKGKKKGSWKKSRMRLLGGFNNYYNR